MKTSRPLSGLLIPVRTFRPAPGRFCWPARGVFASASLRDLRPLVQLAADLKARLSIRAQIETNGWGPADVRLRRTPAPRDPDGYALRIAPGGVEIESATDAGAYYAVQTLRHLLAIHGADLPCGEIVDAPDFSRRAVYLDCSRGKVPTVDTVRQLIEFLASCKINELQLYIENVFTFRRHPAIGRGFDPFTPEDLLAIQEHARLHHVRFVPSLTSFGHFERILMLPPYRALGEYPGHYGLSGGTTLCPSDPRSIRLVSELYGEFLPLFDAVDFNACCDETWELGRGRSAARAKRVGTGRLYLDHLLRLHRLCLKHGKRMNVWADILLQHPETISELPGDLVLLNWDYWASGKRIPQTKLITEAGYSCVVCPGTHGWQSHGSRLQSSMDNVRVFAAEGRRRSAEGLMQTDWGDMGHRNPLGISLHGFAHAAAHAWNGRAVDETVFTDRFADLCFGKSEGRIAMAIRELGRNEERAGTSLYRTLVWRTDGKGTAFQGVSRNHPAWFEVAPATPPPWSEASLAGSQDVVDSCVRTAERLAGVKAAPPFFALALDELRLANAMDRLGARRILAAKKLAAGGSLATGERQRVRDDLLDARHRLKTTWLARNRPSRLRDNLQLLDNHLVALRLRGS